jgi:hypothetical protein
MKDKEPAAGDSSSVTEDKKKPFWKKIWPFGENS